MAVLNRTNPYTFIVCHPHTCSPTCTHTTPSLFFSLPPLSLTSRRITMSKLSTNLSILKKGFPGAYLKEHANDVMMMMLGKKRKLPMTISN
jgi:hypothetical protein